MTTVRITRHPLDGRSYQVGQSVALPDPRAAKLVAAGCATVVGRAGSPHFAEYVESFRKAGKAGHYTAPKGFDALAPSKSTPAKRVAAKASPVTIRLKAAAKVGGRARPAGDTVTVDELKAAVLIVHGFAEMPAKPSPRLEAVAAEHRQVEALRNGRVSHATLF